MCIAALVGVSDVEAQKRGFTEISDTDRADHNQLLHCVLYSAAYSTVLV